ncbi:MAG: uncharacterized protein K0R36_2107 [Chryseobacterium sp.]|nr:uncharacterized protein [Chryseobacterium sp.]
MSHLIYREKVWTLITDIDRWSLWDFNIEYSKYSNSRVRQNGTFVVKHRNFLKVNGIVEENRTYEYFLFRIDLLAAKLYRKYLLEDTAKGLKITVTTSISGFLSWLWKYVVGLRILKYTAEDITIIIENSK